MQRGVQGELAAVRAASSRWSKGVAAAVAGVVGFGLIKGRSDIGQLTPAAGIAVGVLLLATLLAGSVSVYLLMRAAHGGLSPSSTSTGRGLDGVKRVAGTEHLEAIRSASALRRGLAAAALALLFMVSAVAVTWYGPTSPAAQIVIGDQQGALLCGDVDNIADEQVTLVTEKGNVRIPLSRVNSLATVSECGSAGEP